MITAVDYPGSKTAPSAARMVTAVDYPGILVRVASFFLLYCTYVPRVCRVIPCPILLVHASYHTVFLCDNNSVFITPHSEHQLFWWDVLKKASPASIITAVYSYMLEKNPILYQVSAYLVLYCLLLRQQQRFEHPTSTLKQTSVLLGCIQNGTISSKRVRCCTNKHTNRGHNLHGRVVKKQKGKH